MKYSIGVAALTKGLEWLQKAPTGSWNVALIHTHHTRFLQDMSMYHQKSSSNFGSSKEDEMLNQGMHLLKTKCQVDVEELVAKVGVVMMGSDSFGMPMGLDSPYQMDEMDDDAAMTRKSPKSTKVAAEPSVADQVALSNLIQEALTPEGEKQCTKAQNKQYIAATDSFAKCIGFDSAEEMQLDTDHILQIKDACDPAAMMTETDNCTDAVLSDKILGGALRDIYQYPGKYCACLKVLKNDIPACTATMGSVMDESGEKVPADFDEAYRDMKVSLGFAKMELCALGLGCDALDGICVEELNALEKCLVTHPDCNDGISEECYNNLFVSVPTQLSQGLLPDVCVKAYNDHKMTSGVIQDYATFVQKCDPTVTTVVSAQASKPFSPNTSSGKWIDSMVIIGVAVVAVVGFAVALVLHKRKQQKVAFAPVYTDEATEAEMGQFS